MPINASTNTQSDRVPLTANRGVAVFSIGVMGFITANLIPLMIVAMVEDLGVTESAAGAVLTASLLVCAFTCLATTRIASGRHRHLLGRVSLIAMAAAFGIAAIAPSTVIACAAIIIGGIGAGGSASVGGAALAALTNPDRASSISGLVNRLVVTAVLALIPILGTHMTNAFGIVAVLALATAATVTWLPSSPVRESPETAKSAKTTTTLPAGVSAKRLTFAGTAFLAMLAVWAISEDSLWAVLGIMGSEHAGLSDQQMSLALSASTAGGVLAAVTLTALGSRVSRTISISVLLILGAILKLSASLTTDPTIYLALVIAWNTVYAATFIVFGCHLGRSRRGRPMVGPTTGHLPHRLRVRAAVRNFGDGEPRVSDLRSHHLGDQLRSLGPVRLGFPTLRTHRGCVSSPQRRHHYYRHRVRIT
ncbi:MFS transporter [Rhodococcus baikonurensis]|uniref:MFS transporter n=1 Tax=Rhodococcus baikonurensis TaxID=172041 RepID=UPI0037BAEAD5